MCIGLCILIADDKYKVQLFHILKVKLLVKMYFCIDKYLVIIKSYFQLIYLNSYLDYYMYE